MVIKRSRKRDNVKFYIEKEGRNLEHNPNTCIKDSASCKANTTVGSKYLTHVSTMHPLPMNVTGKRVARALAQKEEMIVPHETAKRVLNKCHGLNKKQYRDSFRSLEHLKTFLNTDGNAKIIIFLN